MPISKHKFTYRPNKKSILVGAVCGVLLVGFTVFALLDKIVFTHELTSEAETQTENLGAVNTYAGALDTLSVASAEDNVAISTYRWKNTTITVADIYLENPQQLKSAFARDTFGYNVTEVANKFAERLNPIVMINGDFYGLHDNGYVIRNGVLYRSTPATTGNRINSCVMMNDGSFQIIKETEVSAADLMAQGAWQLFGFGPALVDNGVAVITEENYANGYVHEASQRCAIAWVSDLHYKFIVCGGRSSSDTGLKMWDWADFIAQLGVRVAYNLDGGDSAYMFKGTELITNDVTKSSTYKASIYQNLTVKVRDLSDVIYIAKAA